MMKKKKELKTKSWSVMMKKEVAERMKLWKSAIYIEK